MHSPFGALRYHLPPAERWDNKAPQSNPFISRTTISTGYSAPSCGGKVVAPATKGGMHFLAHQGGCKGFIIRGRLLSIHRRPTTTLAPKGETTHYDLCVALLLQIMFAVHARGASNLSPLRTFGPKGRQPSSPKGACPYHAHEKTG